MDPERLTKDDLEWELGIRGVLSLGTVADMGTALRRFLKHESEGKVKLYFLT